MKLLELNINDKNYKLQMNRTSIKWLEANGFSIVDFENKPLTYYDLLWTSLFIANHPEVNPNLAIKLLETYEKEHSVPSVIKFAIEEYSAFMNALADTKSIEKEVLKITEI